METHPAEAARVLEGLPATAAAAALSAAPADSASSVLGNMDPALAAASLRECDGHRAVEILEQLPVEGVGLILRRLAAEERTALLGGLAKDKLKRLLRALQYPEGSVGSIMDPDFVGLPEDLGVGDAVRRIRRHTAKDVYYVYVTDRDHRLVGVLTLRHLLAASPKRAIGALASRDVARLNVQDSQTAVRNHPSWDRFHALPVVDRSEKLVGVLHHEAMRRLDLAARAHRDPPLLDLGMTFGNLWAQVAVVFLDGLAASLVRARSSGASSEGETDDEG
jgi:magnesium transporter